MIGDAREDVGQPGLRIDIIQPGGLDQGVKDCRALATAVRAAK